MAWGISILSAAMVDRLRSQSLAILAVAMVSGAGAPVAASPGATNSLTPATAGSAAVETVAHTAPVPVLATNAPARPAWEYFAESDLESAKETPPKVDFAAKLEMARHHNLARQYAEATTAYTAILQENAPEPIQQTALLDLAQMAFEQNDLSRSEQVLSQWLARWPKDPKAPEILLRQGLIYRRMGLYTAAITKFYAVMTSALALKPESFDFYQKLVLRAQNEIAQTQFDLGNWVDAANSFARLLRLDAPPANRISLHHRYIQCLAALGRHGDTIAQAEDFLARYPNAPERPEVRFLCASAMKQANRNTDALRQVLTLLQEQHAGQNDLQTLTYWQRRAGNEMANRFYQEGDALKALDIYLALAGLDPLPEWQLPVFYQIGLIYERLSQPTKASEYYANILKREKDVLSSATPSLKAILEMAKWRRDLLDWQVKAELANRSFKELLTATNRLPAARDKSLAQNQVPAPSPATEPAGSPVRSESPAAADATHQPNTLTR